jgi:dTDP-4-amino-4,6-dideoxygalactose transaminase
MVFFDDFIVRVPFNDLKRAIQANREPLMALAGEVLDSGRLILGPQVSAFETEFAAYCGPGLTAVSVASGSDALALALAAAGVVSGDLVICCANAAMHGTLAILSLGARPVYVDITADHTMCVDALGAALERVSARALIVTHLYGQLAQIESIMALARAHNVSVIEDCAQAHGARRDGAMAGSFGRFACFSFYPTKNLGALGDGGAVVCQARADAERLLALRQYGWLQKYYVQVHGGRNSRLDELQAAWLRHGLTRLDANNQRRLALARRYSAEIKHPRVQLPVCGDDYVAHLYVLRAQGRDALRQHLSAQQIGTDIHYPLPDHRQAVFGQEFAGLQLVNTECYAGQVLSLPCFPELSHAEVSQVISAVNSWPVDAP